MKVLVFDTETTGLPKKDTNGNTPLIYASHMWPHIIQLSYVLYDTTKNTILVNHDHIIKIGNNVDLSEKSVEIHGITRAKSQQEGKDICEALELFHICAHNADMIVAHNLSFDRQMILAECYRNRATLKKKYHLPVNAENLEIFPFQKKTRDQLFCTMKNTTDLCCIEAVNKKDGSKYYKYPTLSELHQHLFEEVPQNTHNSLVDVLVCLRCFIYLQYLTDINTINRSFRTQYKNICSY